MKTEIKNHQLTGLQELLKMRNVNLILKYFKGTDLKTLMLSLGSLQNWS